MEQLLENGDLIFRYLTGQLPEEDQVRLEQSYFADDAIFERLLVAEDALIQGYARGHFSGPEREQIEGYFLRSSARRQRVVLARDADRRARSDPKQRPWWRNLMARIGIGS